MSPSTASFIRLWCDLDSLAHAPRMLALPTEVSLLSHRHVLRCLYVTGTVHEALLLTSASAPTLGIIVSLLSPPSRRHRHRHRVATVTAIVSPSSPHINFANTHPPSPMTPSTAEYGPIELLKASPGVSSPARLWHTTRASFIRPAPLCYTTGASLLYDPRLC
ncbi:hypothetical protein BD626DRAFT_570297 [Schizophyllum amplum]|uniref:Uncharacterized protein n=1 Tax=Schizophyllum amplum TaxID=97359 RepID=A0A550CBB4_9AGAR|nr:hypothetical protein BD626DRAFT_570297 [Auriculariopsis ampla]